MGLDKNLQAFLELVKAGLWENDNLNINHDFDGVDWDEVYQLAEEQSVVGLVSAGLDRFIVHVPRFIVPQEWALQFIGAALQLEQQNKEMNSFIAKLIEKMRKADINTIMVKGQAVAQCYERPLWRASGDIDLYLSDDNFQKAKAFFRPLVPAFDPDNDYTRHINMTLEPWVIEIHGNQYTYISARIDIVLKEIHSDLFYNGNVRSWLNNKTMVFLPSPDNDVLIVFTHFLKHFFKGGLGIRQICDWCRLIWTYKDTLNQELLELRIRKAGLMSEWRVFATFAVEYLGMDAKAVPYLNLNDNANVNQRLKRKAEGVKDFILMSGNFGHNRDMSYYSKYPYLIRKFYSMKMRVGDLINHARIFPLDSIRFFFWIMWNGLRSAVRGE